MIRETKRQAAICVEALHASAGAPSVAPRAYQQGFVAVTYYHEIKPRLIHDIALSLLRPWR